MEVGLYALHRVGKHNVRMCNIRMNKTQRSNVQCSSAQYSFCGFLTTFPATVYVSTGSYDFPCLYYFDRERVS